MLFFTHPRDNPVKADTAKKSRASVPSVKMGRMHSHGYGPHLATRCAGRSVRGLPAAALQHKHVMPETRVGRQQQRDCPGHGGHGVRRGVPVGRPPGSPR